MNRYAVIDSKLKREFVLLQGSGCRWKKCLFCDYHKDLSDNALSVNREVLQKVTGVHGVLDVINSGSAMELDKGTIEILQQVVKEKHIHTLWFEAHYMYRHKLAAFAKLFEPAVVKFRCGVETFNTALRNKWQKGIPVLCHTSLLKPRPRKAVSRMILPPLTACHLQISVVWFYFCSSRYGNIGTSSFRERLKLYKGIL